MRLVGRIANEVIDTNSTLMARIRVDDFICNNSTLMARPRGDAGGLSREYVLRIPIAIVADTA